MLRRDIIEAGLSESQIQWLVNEAAKAERQRRSDEEAGIDGQFWKGEVSALMHAAMELGGLNLFEWSDLFQAALKEGTEGNDR